MRGLSTGAAVILWGEGGEALVIEMPVGRGTVIQTAFGFEIDRGNIALTQVFLPMIWRTVQYLTNTLEPRRPDVLEAGRPAVLDVSERQFALVPQVELVAVQKTTPDDEAPKAEPFVPQLLTISDSGTVILDPLPVDRYRLTRPGQAGAFGYVRNIAVNPDGRESRMEMIGKDDLDAIAASRGRVLPAKSLDEIAPTGLELAYLIIILLIIAYALEAAAGFLLSARREKESLLPDGSASQ